jgi:hypothetical protein
MNSFQNNFTISSGIIHTSIKILDYFSHEVNLKDIANIKNVFLTDIKYPILFLEKCGYIKTLKNNEYVLLKNISNQNYIEQFKELLYQYIIEFKPIWINRIKWGLSSFTKDLSANELHCFKEVNLLDFDNFSNIIWWNNLPYFDEQNINLRTIGAIGEFLSLKYEKDRINLTPTHTSLLGGFHGYDILSKMQTGSNENKFIECKSTTNHNDCLINITINEWETALLNKEFYFFHIWKLHHKEKKSYLYEFSVEQMESHIPIRSVSKLGNFTNAQINLTNLLSQNYPLTQYENLSIFEYHLQE